MSSPGRGYEAAGGAFAELPEKQFVPSLGAGKTFLGHETGRKCFPLLRR